MIYLTTQEYSKITNTPNRTVQSRCQSGKIDAVKQINSNNLPQYLIPLTELTPKQQLAYYKSHNEDIPQGLLDKPKPIRRKTYEECTQAERERVNLWERIVNDWDRYCDEVGGGKAAATEAYISTVSKKYPDIKFSPATLYRKKKAVDNNDIAALIDNRGRAKTGYTKVPDELRCLFEYLYLQKHIKVAKCHEAMQLVLQDRGEDKLLNQMPSVDTLYRMRDKIPKVVRELAKGEKSYTDRCEPFIDRDIDGVGVNEIWVADGHTIDVFSQDDLGQNNPRRPTISAIMDLRSGVYVGWIITDNPSSESTVLALRKAIMNTKTTPKYFVCDNGREYLTHDVGGKGHRTRKGANVEMPRTIFDRLGITMVNAMPAHGQSKHIERDFRDFTFLSSLFDTYCGSSITTRPERLKEALKAGKSPKDSELAKIVDTMIEGYFNHQPYTGKAVSDRGKTKIEVYNTRLQELRMPRDENVLNLMLMRTSRMQTVGKNGVSIVYRGERLYYKNDEMHWIQGKRVYVRYDPEDLMSVRVYDANDAFLGVVELNRTMIQPYLSQIDDQNDLDKALSTKRRLRRVTKERLDIISETANEKYGDVDVLRLYEKQAERNIKKETYRTTAPLTTVLYGDESDRLPEAVGETTHEATVDIKRMIRNAEKRKDDY